MTAPAEKAESYAEVSPYLRRRLRSHAEATADIARRRQRLARDLERLAPLTETDPQEIPTNA